MHGHCHHKSLMKMNDELALLRATGSEVEYLDSGCCGMAGPFGFEKEKFEVSQAVGERVLLPAVRRSDSATVIVTDGFSCREQIAQNSTRRAVHFAEAICPEPVRTGASRASSEFVLEDVGVDVRPEFLRYVSQAIDRHLQKPLLPGFRPGGVDAGVVQVRNARGCACTHDFAERLIVFFALLFRVIANRLTE